MGSYLKIFGLGLSLLYLFAHSSLADPGGGLHEKSNWDVNLSGLFEATTDKQQGGSCHMYAAGSLIEGACNRKFKHYVALDKAIPFLTHLIKQFESLSSYDVLDRNKKYIFTDLDGGFIEKSIHLAINEEHFIREAVDSKLIYSRLDKFIHDYREDVYKVSKSWAAKTGLTPVEAFEQIRPLKSSMFPALFVNFLRGEVAAARARAVQYLAKNPYLNRSQSDLEWCLYAGVKLHQESYTLGAALYYLKQGIPFACSGDFKLSANSKPAAHVTTVIGYRKNKNFRSGFEFLVRDSNDSEATGGWSLQPCEILTVLH